MTITIANQTFVDSEAYIFIAVAALAGIVLLLSLIIAILWIKYSLFNRNNSKDWTGAQATKWIFDKSGMSGVEIKNSIFYLKYWNYNKRRGTYRLRPWTYGRRSIWTLMEAAQQAYASSIRESRGTTFWMLFRMPRIVRVLGIILGAVFLVLGIRNFEGTFGNWSLIGLGIATIFIAYLIADCGRLYVLWKNVPKLLEDSGLTQKELRAIKRIYFWRLMYSIAAVILELVKLALKILKAANDKNKRG